MGTILEDLLKEIDDTAPLSDSIQKDAHITEMLDAYHRYQTNYDSTLPQISETSSGREFKNAIDQLPSLTRLEILNRYLAAKKEVEGDAPKTDDPVEQIYENQKKNLTYVIIVGFFGLALITIISVVSLSIMGKQIPDGQIFNTIISTMVEVFKILTGGNQ